MIQSRLPQGRPEGAPTDSLDAQIIVADGRKSVLQVALDLVGLVRRNWLVVLGSTAIGFGAGWYIVQREVPIYRATATVRFDDQARALSAGIGGGPVPRAAGPITDPILTQIQMLQSRGVAAAVVDREGLRVVTTPWTLRDGWIKDIRVSPNASGQITLSFTSRGVTATTDRARHEFGYGVPVEIGGVGFSVARHPGVETVLLELMSRERATDNVMGHLRGRPRDRTDIIDISYEAESPEVAQRLVNAGAHVFSELNAQSANQEALRKRQFIEAQLGKVEVLLADAQRAHNDFRSREKAFSIQERFRSEQMGFIGIDVRRQELQADRNMYASLLGSLEDTSHGTTLEERLNALIASPGMGDNPIIENLYSQFTRLQTSRDSLMSGPFAAAKRSPEVMRAEIAIVRAESSLMTAVRGQIRAADVRLASLDTLKMRSASAMSALPTVEAAETRLLARVEAYSKEAERLREALQKAQIEEAAQVGQISIVDLATVPRFPIGTGKQPRVLFMVFLGLAFGTVLAYVRENYSAVVRRREDVERVSSIPILAVVPPFGSGVSRSNRLLAWVQPSRNGHALTAQVEHAQELVTATDLRSHAAEAYRTLRTNLLFSTEVGSLRHIVVTSAGPGEGKSTTAANLAVVFAQQGKRVLLIDCDLRRARLHKIFRKPHIPGITNTLVKGTSYADAVLPTEVENLMLMPAGSTPPNPVELLGSARMRELTDRLAENFDLLVFDTPPVLVASDATILSRHADATLFVVRAGKTQSGAFRDGLERLAAVGTPIIGTLINDPSSAFAKFASYYGYYQDEYYGDLAGKDSGD